MITDKWANRFMSLAREVSTWSKDPSSRLGAIAVNDERQILSHGYNGFPRNFDDSEELYADRSIKYPRVVHAEMNVIYNATYNGVSLKDTTVFVYGLKVCPECAKGLIQVGVKKVYMYPINSSTSAKWNADFELTKQFFEEANVEYEIL